MRGKFVIVNDSVANVQDIVQDILECHFRKKVIIKRLDVNPNPSMPYFDCAQINNDQSLTN